MNHCEPRRDDGAAEGPPTARLGVWRRRTRAPIGLPGGRDLRDRRSWDRRVLAVLCMRLDLTDEVAALLNFNDHRSVGAASRSVVVGIQSYLFSLHRGTRDLHQPSEIIPIEVDAPVPSPNRPVIKLYGIPPERRNSIARCFIEIPFWRFVNPSNRARMAFSFPESSS